METWDLWYPKAGATGLPFARGRIDAAQVLLIHAAPPLLTVTVRDGDGALIAEVACRRSFRVALADRIVQSSLSEEGFGYIPNVDQELVSFASRKPKTG